MASFINNQIKSEKSEIKEIWKRIKTRNFSGNTGLAVKNSIYNFSTTFISKIGSLIFVVILARLLMPKLLGLYSLALSTILVFAAISELGIGSALIRFVSNSLGKKKTEKAQNYIRYFGKIKFLLVLIGASLLLIFSKFIAQNYYQKPIFLALLAGGLYIIFIQATLYLNSVLNAYNNFKNVFFREVIFQVSRIILAPLAIVYALKLSLSDETILFYIILFLAISYLFVSIYLFIVAKKKSYFEKTKSKKQLSEKDKKEANKFVFLTATIALSGVFFGNIDKIMLGRFVSGEFIGYYQAAFSLVGSLASLGAFGAVLLPIFSRMKEKDVKRAMKKTIRFVLLLGFGGFLLTLAFSYPGILIIYGQEYLQAVNILRLLSVLVIFLPLIAIYASYYMSENKPEIIAKSLVFSTILNIILNYLLITYMLNFGQIQAVYGAVIATLISKGVYLGGLCILKKN